MTRAMTLRLFLSLSLLTYAAPAPAFQILSFVTEPCHENITLGLVGYGAPEFQIAPASTSLLNRLVAKAAQQGVPNDPATFAILKEMSARFHWNDLDLPTRYVLTSLVAGVRAPDTKGFAILDIDHIRGNHLDDSAQARHMLRKRTNDGADGNVSAIAQTRSEVSGLMNSILSNYGSPNLIRSQSWTFPFYGEQDVHLLSTAFDLGQLIHSVEDSYSHAIRDDQFKILAVANYIEAIKEGDKDDDRDGPPHSERLDRCNMNDSFDSLRIRELHRQAIRVFNEIDNLLAANSQNNATVEAILDDIFAYTPGCNNSNDYCGSEWIQKSREDISKPYKLGLNCGLIKTVSASNGDGPSAPTPAPLMMLIMLLSAPLAVSYFLRSRSRRESAILRN